MSDWRKPLFLINDCFVTMNIQFVCTYLKQSYCNSKKQKIKKHVLKIILLFRTYVSISLDRFLSLSHSFSVLVSLSLRYYGIYVPVSQIYIFLIIPILLVHRIVCDIIVYLCTEMTEDVRNKKKYEKYKYEIFYVTISQYNDT